MTKPKTIELKIPSEMGYEKLAMRLVADVATRMGFSPDRVDDLKTAISEACINAIEHGNQFDLTTKVYIALTIDENRLAIDVADEGRGGPAPTTFQAPDLASQIDGFMPAGGMGLFLIRALVDQAEFVEPELASGNQLRMIIHLAN